jgi:hypothetical protein
MKNFVLLLAAVALVLFIAGCISFVASVGKGVQNYNQQNPTCQISNPAWPSC